MSYFTGISSFRGPLGPVSAVSSPLPPAAAPSLAALALEPMQQGAAAAPRNPLYLISTEGRDVVQPQFGREQEAYLKELLKENPLATSQMPLIHLLHANLYDHLFSALEFLKAVCMKYPVGDRVPFVQAFQMIQPYIKLSHVFFLLYGNHLDQSSIQSMLPKKLLPLQMEGQLIHGFLKKYQEKFKENFDTTQDRGFQNHLEAFKKAWDVLTSLEKAAAGGARLDKLILVLQRMPFAEPEIDEEGMLQQLIQRGMPGMLREYLATVQPTQALHPIRDHQNTVDLGLVNRDLEAAIELKVLLLRQKMMEAKVMAMLDHLASPDFPELQRALGLQNVEQKTVIDTLRVCLCSIQSTVSLNTSICKMLDQRWQFNQMDHKNAHTLRARLFELAAPLFEEAELDEQGAEVDQTPSSLSQVDLSKGSTPPLTPPSIAQAPSRPATPPRNPQAPLRREEKELSPFRAKKGDSIRVILQQLDKLSAQMTRQKGSHRQYITPVGPFTLAVHPNAAIGPRTALELKEIEARLRVQRANNKT